MVSLAAFFRHAPPELIARYFDFRDLSMTEPLTGSQRPLKPALIDTLLNPKRSEVMKDIERIASMADEGGETALYGVSTAPKVLNAQPNRYGRALWMFLENEVEFRRAEDVRYTDEHRRGRKWDGFTGTAGLLLRQEPDALEGFRAALRKRFDTSHVHVDIFERHRPTFDGPPAELVQLTIYREGPPNDVLQFQDGSLARLSQHSVLEAALTYESSSGVIEVVASDRAAREDYVRLLASHLLGAELPGERLPLRRYDLAVLTRRHKFGTDPVDGVDSVRVVQLRLMPLDTAAERVALECKHEDGRTIWDMAASRFGSSSPLSSGWMVTQAKLVIKFQPRPGGQSRRALPVTITVPHGCDLKDRTERERIVGEKYLRVWGIVRDG